LEGQRVAFVSGLHKLFVEKDTFPVLFQIILCERMCFYESKQFISPLPESMPESLPTFLL
jgi:hypothetical protein